MKSITWFLPEASFAAIFILAHLLFAGCGAIDNGASPQAEAAIVEAAAGDSVQVVEGGSDVYDRPNGAIVDFVAGGTVGLVTRAKTGWAEVDFEGVTLAGDVVPDSNLEAIDSEPPCTENCEPPPVGDVDRVVIVGCSNTDNILNHWNSSVIEANPAGGQAGLAIVRYGESDEGAGVWSKFKTDTQSAGTDLDLAIYMICQRWDYTGQQRPGARWFDVPYSLPANESGSALYSEHEMLQNILGEMRFILDGQGQSAVPVAAMAMHFYEPEGTNANPCVRIGENGILAQWDYADAIDAAGAQSSLLRPGQTFTPAPLVEDGEPWRMPPVSQDGDATSEGCHLTQSYVQSKFIPAFELMAAGL